MDIRLLAQRVNRGRQTLIVMAAAVFAVLIPASSLAQNKTEAPFSANYPFPNCRDDGECIVARAFEFRNGRMTDLGVLSPGFSSDTNWISPSGLISGEAQTGETADPSVGGWTMHGILWAHGRMIDLGTLDRGAISLTTGVNDSAEVSGFALNTIPDPFSFQPPKINLRSEMSNCYYAPILLLLHKCGHFLLARPHHSTSVHFSRPS